MGYTKVLQSQHELVENSRRVLEFSHSSTHRNGSSCNDEVDEGQLDALFYVKALHSVIAVDR